MDFSLSLSSNVLTIVPEEQLTTNRQYTVTILHNVSGLIPVDGGTVDALDSNYLFWFTSTYCPLFTTLGRVKLLVGPKADTLIDDTIYRMIHKNSLDAVDLYNLSASSTYSYDYWGCDWQNVPLKLKRYVECKTAYDILALLKNTNNGGVAGGGAQLKALGDMTIKYGGTNTGNNPALDSPTQMKEMYDCWNEMLRSFRNIRTAVKGYYDQSKGFVHPTYSTIHNRVLRPVTTKIGTRTPGTQDWRGIWRGM